MKGLILMRRRIIQIIMLLAFIVCIINIYKQYSLCDTNIRNARSQNNAIAYSKSTVPPALPHNPNVPRKLKLPIGNIELLMESDSRKDIVAWIDKSAITKNSYFSTIVTRDPSYTEWLLVRFVGTSGSVVWTVLLYQNYPYKVGKVYHSRWILRKVDYKKIRTTTPWDIDCTYIDENSNQLVFADRHGKKIGAIDIRQ